MDLEVPRADRRLDPVAVSAGLLERPRDGRLAGAEEPQHAPPGGVVRSSNRREGLRPERRRPEPLQLTRRPGQNDDDAPLVLEQQTRRRAGETERDRALRGASPACGRRPRSPRYGRRRRSRERPGDLADLGLELRDDRERTTRSRGRPARPCGRRGSARGRRRRRAGRPRGPRGAPARALRAGRRRSRSGAGSRPSDSSSAREEGTVQVRALAADELAAGDDDRGRAAGSSGSRRCRCPWESRRRRSPSSRRRAAARAAR